MYPGLGRGEGWRTSLTQLLTVCREGRQGRGAGRQGGWETSPPHPTLQKTLTRSWDQDSCWVFHVGRNPKPSIPGQGLWRPPGRTGVPWKRGCAPKEAAPSGSRRGMNSSEQTPASRSSCGAETGRGLLESKTEACATAQPASPPRPALDATPSPQIQGVSLRILKFPPRP